MRLNQNMQSLNVYRNYKKNLVTQSIALDRISTGTKINSAKDNPNKLGVSEGLRIQIRGLQMAERNIQDGVSMMQSVDGALNTVSEALNRIKELTVQAGGVQNDEDLSIIQGEINQLKEHIDYTVNNSEFNGVKLLNSDKVTNQAGGVQNDEDLSIIQGEINQLKEHIDYTVNNSEFNGVKLLNSDKVTNNDYPKYLNHVVGANTKEEINIPVFNVTTDMLIDLEGNSLKNINITNTNELDKNLNIVDSAIETMNSVRSRYGAIQNRMDTSAQNLSGNINITNTNELDKNLNIVDSAIETMNSVRSRYGAIQNRMDTSAQNLSGSSFNLENAESRIRDSDIALEMAEYARTSILHETSIALMQQTNRFPQDVLRVLENMK